MGSVLNKESKATGFIIFGVHLLAHLNHLLKRNKRKALIKKRKGAEIKEKKKARGLIASSSRSSSSRAL